MPLVISGGLLVDDDPPRVRRGHLLLEAGRVRDIFAEPPSMRADREWIDATGCLVLPGFVCGHTHLYRSLARGGPVPLRPPRSLRETLGHSWWPYDRALDREVLPVAAQVAGVEALRAGVTTVLDHHASPYACAQSLDLLADALQGLGMRGVLSYEISDREGREERQEGVAEARRFFQENRRPRIRGMLGAQSSSTLSDEALLELVFLAQEFGAGLHIHAAEDSTDQEETRARYGLGVVERLKSAGLLQNKTILAHGVHLSVSEAEMIRQSGAWLVHNPRANQAQHVGYASAIHRLDRVALGTDGVGADMFEEARAAFHNARAEGFEVAPGWAWSLLHNTQRLAGHLLGEPFGFLRAGAPADVVVLAYDAPTPLRAENFAEHLLYGIHAGQVRDVIIAGRVVMRDYKLLTADEAVIRSAARPLAVRLWESIQDPGYTDPSQTVPEEDF